MDATAAIRSCDFLAWLASGDVVGDYRHRCLEYPPDGGSSFKILQVGHRWSVLALINISLLWSTCCDDGRTNLTSLSLAFTYNEAFI